MLPLPPEAHFLKRRRPVKWWLETLFTGPLQLWRIVHPPVAPAPDRVERILIVRHNQLGDAVVAGVLVEALRVLYPVARIEVLASVYNHVVFRWIPGVDAVHVRPRKFLDRLALVFQLRNRYQLVFQTLFDENYLHRASESRLIAGRGFLIGRARNTPLQRLFDRAVTLPVGSTPGKLLSLLAPLGAADTAMLTQRHAHLRLNLPADVVERVRVQLEAQGLAQRRFVVLNISARELRRQLEDEQAIGIARALIQAGHRVLLSGAPSDAARMDAIGRAVPALNRIDFATLTEAMAALSLSGLYVGPDTGSAHFAAAFGLACVVVFSPHARPDIWSPYGVPFISIQANEGMPVASVPATIVVDSALRLLAGDRVCEIKRPAPPFFPLEGSPDRWDGCQVMAEP